MGTIGDLLGDALGQALASNSDAAPVEAIEGAREQAAEERAEHVRQVVQDALVSNASVVPENIDDACLLSALYLYMPLFRPSNMNGQSLSRMPWYPNG